MNKLIETVTVTREVPSRIADLVYFVRFVSNTYNASNLTDEELIKLAHDFWENQHGEE
jgi:hypothetical protein